MKPQQKIILTATVDKNNHLSLNVDFYPKMPTAEEYNILPDDKKACVAVVNRLAKLNKDFIAELLKLEAA